MSSSDDKSDTFETASVNSLVNFFNSSLSTENDSFSLVTSFDSVASSTWFLFSLGFSSALIDFKIEVNELTSFAFLSAPDCVAFNALKYCLASATSFSAFWIWEACFLFPRIRSIWASKSANFACKRDKSTDGFAAVSSAELVLPETVEECLVSFSFSFTDFGCSANSDFTSETVSTWVFTWAWFSPVSTSFVATVSVAEVASTVSTL